METKTTKSTSKTTASATTTAPTQEAIEWRAYELWLQRGATGGSALEDWIAAEQELLASKPARKRKAA